MIATAISMAVEIEKQRLRCRAPDRFQLLPLKTGIGVDVVRVELQNLLTIALRSTDQIVLRHTLSAQTRCILRRHTSRISHLPDRGTARSEVLQAVKMSGQAA